MSGRVLVSIVDPGVDADRKRWAGLAARLALAGYEATRSNPNDGPTVYSVSRWGLVRTFTEVSAVERFAQQAGATV